jgi:hypothetical protein
MGRKGSVVYAIRECDYCGISFRPVKKWQRFCGIPCHNNHWSEKRIEKNKLADKIISDLQSRIEALEKKIAER